MSLYVVKLRRKIVLKYQEESLHYFYLKDVLSIEQKKKSTHALQA